MFWKWSVIFHTLKSSSGLGEEQFCSFVFIHTLSLARQPRWLWGETLLKYSWRNLGLQLSVHIRKCLHIHYRLMGTEWSRELYQEKYTLLVYISVCSAFCKSCVCAVSMWASMGLFIVRIRSFPQITVVFTVNTTPGEAESLVGSLPGSIVVIIIIVISCLIKTSP